MEQFSEGDYIEHWENGVGRVIRIDETSVHVDFLKRGEILFEKEKTVHFIKLNPSGLLVQMYENFERIQDLLKQESTEIIKLLINDEDKGEKRQIERSRIKSLLTKAKPTDRGWRREFGLVEEKNWKKWWTNVSKKLVKDPQFDTSSKSIIKLRERPVSEAHNLYERFLAEIEVEKKLSICEQLVKAINKDTEKNVLKEVQAFITKIVEKDSDADIFYQGIFNAILLKNIGVDVEPLDKKAYELVLKTLLSGKLPSVKAISIYSFFKKLPDQNLFDHLIIFLHSDKKLREAIANNLKRGKKKAEVETREKILSKDQILAVNSLKMVKQGLFESGLVDLVELKSNKDVTDFLCSVLLSKFIDLEIKDKVFKKVIEFKANNTIYDYLARFQIAEDTKVPFFPEFLSVLGSENAELCLKNMLLTEKVAQERPKVFVAVLRSLASDQIPCINSTQKNRLINGLTNQLLKPFFNENVELKLKISQILADIDTSKRLAGDFEDSDLIDMAETRGMNFSKRRGAIKVLTKKGLKSDCQSIALNLTKGINAEEFILLEDILKSFPDADFIEELFKLIVERSNFSEEASRNAFRKLLEGTDLITSFLESIFLKRSESWQNNTRENIKHLVNDEYLSREIIKFGLERITWGGEKSTNMIGKLATLYPPLVKLVLEEVNEYFVFKKALMDEEIGKIKGDCAEEIQELIYKHEIEVRDAVDKTLQRNEEYLKRLLPVLVELKSARKMIHSLREEREMANFQKEMVDRLTSISEDIEGVLKILNVLERE